MKEVEIMRQEFNLWCDEKRERLERIRENVLERLKIISGWEETSK